MSKSVLPADIEITGYAWMRFVTRQIIYTGRLPFCPMEELRRLLDIAVPEDIKDGAVQRLLNNGLEPAAYFQAETWRIVTDEEVTKVVTIEKALLGRRKKRKGRRPWWS